MTRRRGSRCWTIACLLAFAALLIGRLVPEWQLDPQYRYGFFVPLLAVLLAWRAWESRPAQVPDGGLAISLLLVLVVFSLVPAEIVATANPDWRLALWVYAGLVCMGMLLLLQWYGGWARCFAGAIALFFFAVPWPSGMEQSLVQGMMRVVAGVTDEVCNLIGIPVDARGNVLRLRSGEWVGIEEACSGVRSLQSSLMAAYFFGRWMRLSPGLSLLLIASAAALSFGFNCLRAVGLTMLAHFRGISAVAEWHDFAGNSVAVVVFFCLFLISIMMERERELPPMRGGGGSDPGESCSRVALPIALVCALCCVRLWPVWWFASDSGSEPPSAAGAGIAWAGVPARVNYEPIDERTRAQLRYSSGEHGWWVDGGGLRFDLYDFHWDGGKISSFGEVHRPDICLPAAGLPLLAKQPRCLRIAIGGRELDIQRFTFGEEAPQILVFFCAWNLRQDGRGIPLVSSAAVRLENAWHRRRVGGRRVVQLLVSGTVAGAADIDAQVGALLRGVLR